MYSAIIINIYLSSSHNCNPKHRPSLQLVLHELVKVLVVLVADQVDLAPEVDTVVEETILHAAGPLIVAVAKVVLHVKPGVLVEVAETEIVHGVLVGVRPLVGLLVIERGSSRGRYTVSGG